MDLTSNIAVTNEDTIAQKLYWEFQLVLNSFKEEINNLGNGGENIDLSRLSMDVEELQGSAKESFHDS